MVFPEATELPIRLPIKNHQISKNSKIPTIGTPKNTETSKH
jgi:hypothetical protein